jgi:hypothetical protein
MSGRWQKILDRFPAHMEAERQGKAFQDVTEGLAQNLDTLTSALGRVRRAHRLADADEIRDLIQLGQLHGFRPSEMALLLARVALTKALLHQAGADDAAAEAVGRLWGIAPPGFRLNRYAIDQPASAQKTRTRFLTHARKATNTAALVSAVRQRIVVVAATHAQGNGTVRAVAVGAANALDCDVTAIDHSPDRYIHRATIRDRMTLTYPVVQSNQEHEAAFLPADEEILIEENPLERIETGSLPRRHGQRFSVIRRGFERTALRVIVTGTGPRTIGPMLVNRDEGQGVGFAGLVAEGSTLMINEEGRAILDGLDTTSRAFGWRGGCFADGSQPHPKDFVFAGDGAPAARATRFAEATPEGSLGAMFTFPHAGDSVPPLGIGIGETRFVFFAQQGFFSYESPDGTLRRVEPRPSVAFIDGSVFAAVEGEESQTAALLALSWLERCAFRARIWIPHRFLQLTPDDEEGLATRRQVLEAVERFRPAAVRLDIDFIDNRWVLGRGMIFQADQQPADQGPGIGMELWTAPQEG